jgi:hypothetical protein
MTARNNSYNSSRRLPTRPSGLVENDLECILGDAARRTGLRARPTQGRFFVPYQLAFRPNPSDDRAMQVIDQLSQATCDFSAAKRGRQRENDPNC